GTCRIRASTDPQTMTLSPPVTAAIPPIRPGDPRYMSAAASAGRIKVVFRSGESAGIGREIALRGGERLLVYLVQDRSTAMLLARTAEDRPGRPPRIFYAYPAANPDRLTTSAPVGAAASSGWPGRTCWA